MALEDILVLDLAAADDVSISELLNVILILLTI
jgi:hypothetical protein